MFQHRLSDLSVHRGHARVRGAVLELPEAIFGPLKLCYLRLKFKMDFRSLVRQNLHC